MMHIGNRIKTVLTEQQRTASWLAQHLFCDRTNVYKIFKKESIDTDLLMRICKIMSYNFFADLADDLNERGN